MIKQSTRTETKEVTDTIYICDRCGKEAEGSMYRRALQECGICGKEVCRKCRMGFDDFESEDPYVMGDRPYHRACKVCWETGRGYRYEMREVQDKADEEKGIIMEEWRGACAN